MLVAGLGAAASLRMLPCNPGGVHASPGSPAAATAAAAAAATAAVKFCFAAAACVQVEMPLPRPPSLCSCPNNLAQVEAIRARERAKMASKAAQLKGLGPTYNELAEGEA